MLRTGSGPLLDRIEIHIEVPRVEYEKLSDDRLGETSAAIRTRVEAARERQRRRFVGTALLTNADMGPAEVREYCPVDDAGRSLLRAAMQQRPGGTRMSARAYHRILKWARTIADSSILSGQAWRGVKGSKRCILRLRSGQAWRRRASIGREGKVERPITDTVSCLFDLTTGDNVGERSSG
jgi:Magnesium chelatase, subunit ChlI C-terminal